ncbi:Uncharacterized protein LB4E_0118 [Leptospira borgpetersenii str. 4E]|nr:Uncharacterized protein LB4E_0118 [Leptospira borgpetersenii str. 4E]
MGRSAELNASLPMGRSAELNASLPMGRSEELNASLPMGRSEELNASLPMGRSAGSSLFHRGLSELRQDPSSNCGIESVIPQIQGMRFLSDRQSDHFISARRVLG